MPPRYTYWTIILEGKPTAFRAREAEELLPTLKQLQVRHPDAVMLWFARGRLWPSPAAERDAARRGTGERRTQGWRPGGEHRDPRERFKVPRDEKRRRFAAKQRRERMEGARPPQDRERSGAGHERPPRATFQRSGRPADGKRGAARRPQTRGNRRGPGGGGGRGGRGGSSR